MGCVWRAEHRTLHTPVAVKLLTPGTQDDADLLARFSREAQAAASLRSPNVVQILDHGVDNGVPYIAMEYLEGETLGARLRRLGKLSPAETASVLTGVVRAMARAHRVGIVHRDLKPDNIFLARDEESGIEIVKVLDFGIAKLVDHEVRLGPASTKPEPGRAARGVAEGDPPAHADPSAGGGSTRTGVMLGTPCYVSPEQARALKDIDARTDLWSFAVIAFECLLGRRPFDGDVLAVLMIQICVDPIPRPSSVGPVPEGFDSWFERATQREPADRFQNVRDLTAGLAALLTPGEAWLDRGALSEPASGPTAEGVDKVRSERGAKAAVGPAVPPALSTTTGQVTSRPVLAGEGARAVSTVGRPAMIGSVVAVLALVAAFAYGRRAPSPPASATTTGAAAAQPTESVVAPPIAPPAIVPSAPAPSVPLSAPATSASAANAATKPAASAAPPPPAAPSRPRTPLPAGAPTARIDLGI